jgi:phenylalanine-4-hydroxylase
VIGQFCIEQRYELYTQENHDVWRVLYARIRKRWERHATGAFLQGLDALRLHPERIPRLAEVNRALEPLTGFQAQAVSGYVPAFVFFDCLRNREFPTTVTIRSREALDYLPEPDIFHDVAGHVPLHTDVAFADALARFGECAGRAAEMVSGVRDASLRMKRLRSIYRALARFFWFTVEFGLMRGKGAEYKAYGSGLLSSYGELEHALVSMEVQREPLRLEWVIHQSFAIDEYQPLLFVVDSFEHLYELVGRLEQWMCEGRLDNVAPGEPEMSEADLQGFLARAAAS